MGDLGALTLRPFDGSDDLPAMTELINARVLRDGEGSFVTLSDMVGQYSNLQRCDPRRDIVVAVADGRVVGYARTQWDDVSEGHRQYWLITEADPDVPRVEDELASWIEQRAMAVAAEHSGDRRLVAEEMVDSERARQLEGRGFRASMYSAVMVRPHLDDIPDRDLPAGLEIRPFEESHLRSIWEADIEAFRDHRGYVEQTESDWHEFVEEVSVQDKTLWQVAWHDDRVVGQVRAYSNAAENERFGRKRAWTEEISTIRDWRGRGVAKALICASLRQVAERGFDEAALGVDTENPSQALGLYESLGYRQVALWGLYERLIDGEPVTTPGAG